MLRKGSGLETAERNKLGQELKKVIVDQQWVIGTVGFIPVLRIIGNKMGNVPDRYAWRDPGPDAGRGAAVHLLLQELAPAPAVRRSAPRRSRSHTLAPRPAGRFVSGRGVSRRP